MQIKTTNLIIELKDESELTFGDKRKLQKAFLSSSQLDTTGKKDISFTASTMFDVQDELLKVLLVSITEKKDNKVITDGLFDYLMDLKTDDGEKVYEEVTKMFSSIFSKKK